MFSHISIHFRLYITKTKPKQFQIPGSFSLSWSTQSTYYQRIVLHYVYLFYYYLSWTLPLLLSTFSQWFITYNNKLQILPYTRTCQVNWITKAHPALISSFNYIRSILIDTTLNSLPSPLLAALPALSRFACNPRRRAACLARGNYAAQRII